MRTFNLNSINFDFLPVSVQDTLHVVIKHKNNPKCKVSVHDKALDAFDGEVSKIQSKLMTEIYAGLSKLITRNIELNEFDIADNDLFGFAFDIIGLGRCKMTVSASGRCAVSKVGATALYGNIMHASDFYVFDEKVIGKYMVDSVLSIIEKIQQSVSGVNLQ